MIRFGHVSGDSAGFVLQQPFPTPGDVAFLLGESFVEMDGVAHRLRDQNGIEALALGNLRADLEAILEHREGGLRVADHDGSLEVALWLEGDQVLAFVTVPNAASWNPPLTDSLWDRPIAPMTFDDLTDMISEISATEAKYGPLVGHCGCGAPPRSWPGFDPRQ